MNGRAKFELISPDGRPVTGAQLWPFWIAAIAAIIAFTIWNPTHGAIFLGTLLVGTVIGPMIPIVNLIASNFWLLSAAAAGITVGSTTASGNGETDIALHENGWVLFGLWVALTICGFLVASGGQTLWWSWKWHRLRR